MRFCFNRSQLKKGLAQQLAFWSLAFLVQCLVLLGLATPSHAHGANWRISLTRMEIVPGNAFLDVKITGNGSDLRDIIHARPKNFSPLDPLDEKARQRAFRYFKKHLVLSQKGTVLDGVMQSVTFLPSDQKGLALFEAKARYPRDPALATEPLKITTTVFDYLPVPVLVITLGDKQMTLVSRGADTAFPGEWTIITPTQRALSYGFFGFFGLWRSLEQLALLLALLLASVRFSWRSRGLIAGSFVLAHSLGFALESLQILGLPSLWWAIGVAASLLYLGIENWPNRKKSVSGLLVAAFVCGVIGGGLVGSTGPLLPEEGRGLCLLAFAVGTLALVALASLVVFPAADFLKQSGQEGSWLSRAKSSSTLRPLGRAVAAVGYLSLVLVAGLNLASAMQARKAPAIVTPTKPASTPATPPAPDAGGSYQTVEEMTQVHTVFTQVSFASSPRQPVAGWPTKWTIKVRYKEDGEPVEDFALLHAKLLHLIVVSRDMTWYTHIHPVYQGNGTFVINTVLPHAGYYRFYADYMPEGQNEHEVVLHEFKVSGDNELAPKPNLVPDQMKGIWMTQQVKAAPEGLPDVGNGPMYEVALMPMPATIRANEPLMLHYQVRDAQGKPLTDLRPYMGAMGHCVVLNTNAKTYLHVHPMAEGMKHTSMTLSQMLTMKMDDTLLPTSYRGGPNVMFHTFFPKPGLYKVWAQFQHREKIITSAFVLKVQ